MVEIMNPSGPPRNGLHSFARLGTFARVGSRQGANTGHSPTACRTGQIDPKHAFKIGLLDGR
jgi:hypothetical protein